MPLISIVAQSIDMEQHKRWKGGCRGIKPPLSWTEICFIRTTFLTKNNIKLSDCSPDLLTESGRKSITSLKFEVTLRPLEQHEQTVEFLLQPDESSLYAESRLKSKTRYFRIPHQ